MKSIYLAGGGEPCAHPKIHEITERFWKAGLSIGMITNGTLFSSRLMDIGHYFSYLQISLISPQEENYNQSTGSKIGFDRMKALPREIKELHGDQSPVIGGMFVLTQWNYRKAFETIEFCRTNDFDYCSFRVAIDFEDRGIGLPEYVLEHLRKEAEKLSPILDSYTNLSKILAGPTVQNYQPTRCVNIQYGLYAIVDPKGHVFLCIPDVGKKELCIGDLNQQTFTQIWAQYIHRKTVKGLKDRYCKGLCHASCRSHKYNEIAQKPKPQDLPNLHAEFL